MMKSLEWVDLASAFYEFEAKAKKYGFFVPELNNMANSLEDMRPYKSSTVLEDTARIIAEVSDCTPYDDGGDDRIVVFNTPTGPVFNENDEAVFAVS